MPERAGPRSAGESLYFARFIALPDRCVARILRVLVLAAIVLIGAVLVRSITDALTLALG